MPSIRGISHAFEEDTAEDDLVAGLKSGTLPSAVTVHVALLRPESTGEVTLWSANPLARPRIRPSCGSNSSSRIAASFHAGMTLPADKNGASSPERKESRDWDRKSPENRHSW